MFESQRHTFKGTGERCEQCPQLVSHWIHQPSPPPSRVDELEARVQSLLESNNELLERARSAERQCLVKDNARVILEEKLFALQAAKPDVIETPRDQPPREKFTRTYPSETMVVLSMDLGLPERDVK